MKLNSVEVFKHPGEGRAKRRLMLIDGNAMIHHAAYFMPRHLSNKEGFPTWAIKGFLNMFQSEMSKFDPSHVAVFFDNQSKKRLEISKGSYKAHRKVDSGDAQKEQERADLRKQFKPIRQIVRSMGYHVCRIKDVEADDPIGTYATSYKNTSVLIRARDKDFNQLITPWVSVLDTWSGKIEVRDAAHVVNRYQVAPSQFAAYLALVGDTADNIPKVSGIGPKTAAALLKGGKTLEEAIKGMKKKHKKIIRHAYSLTEIDLTLVEAPVLKELRRKEPTDKYEKLIKKYNLKGATKL
jgi:DNA polymerase-1